ncbi:molybdenum ABC transporter, periplasmic molybdate-binding protein [Methanocella conradii HZ254]|uniref:Molybdenum ABC transporter, periplasmic molybdate-binding protein n=1 Tax=Methanocella conradii (strain DSM 24694 / JCM 17849 / CGMCC 1.5162 / HZ254) TaxID=1041930 RepID=H8I6M9_METCZ|nr:molybdate ABC transporter substrate-binding protein [Methanocella conradii]AFC98921.1 molybdenum ABC transporter, periplasmic molybdate-binding protein [Methanocella conradii HZ254]
MEKNVKLVSGIFIMALMLAVLVAGCGGPSATPAATPKADLTVFAAASLSGAFNETKAAYEASHPNVNIIYNFDGTQSLRTQVEQGAYADVFASASASHMNALKGEGYMNNSTVANFANNKLAVIVPKDNPAKIGSLHDLANPGVKIVMGTKDVPVGSYTLQILDKMANNSSYGPDYRSKVMANVISQETTVNYVVAKVALGEADAGFVYVSDVPAEYRDKVSVVAIPDSLNVVAVYPIGVLKESKHPEEAQKFIDFVRSDEGKAILAKYGFTPV